MAVFIVIVNEPHAELPQRIASEFPDSFSFSDRAWLVQSELTALAVSRALGVSERSSDGAVTSTFGHIFVSQLSPNYWGFATASLWDWVKAKFERSA